MHEFIDRKDAKILAELATAQVFKKQGLVKSRPAIVGEVVNTTLKNTKEETTNTAKADQCVMTNPSGENYIMDEKDFFNRYEKADEDGVYQAKGHCRAIKNPFNKDIEILAEWGKAQFGDQDCLIVDMCDSEGNNLTNEPYLIAADEFAETYAAVAAAKN